MKAFCFIFVLAVFAAAMSNLPIMAIPVPKGNIFVRANAGGVGEIQKRSDALFAAVLEQQAQFQKQSQQRSVDKSKAKAPKRQ